jgi:hypothetical protein
VGGIDVGRRSAEGSETCARLQRGARRRDTMIAMNAIYTLGIQELLAGMGCNPPLLFL